jgi:hypothetical protein
LKLAYCGTTPRHTEKFPPLRIFDPSGRNKTRP